MNEDGNGPEMCELDAEVFELDRAMLTDDLFWEMIQNPGHRVPFLVR